MSMTLGVAPVICGFALVVGFLFIQSCTWFIFVKLLPHAVYAIVTRGSLALSAFVSLAITIPGDYNVLFLSFSNLLAQVMVILVR